MENDLPERSPQQKAEIAAAALSLAISGGKVVWKGASWLRQRQKAPERTKHRTDIRATCGGIVGATHRLLDHGRAAHSAAAAGADCGTAIELARDDFYAVVEHVTKLDVELAARKRLAQSANSLLGAAQLLWSTLQRYATSQEERTKALGDSEAVIQQLERAITNFRKIARGRV